MSEVGFISHTRHNHLFTQMPEVYAALIGAAATAFLMVLSNVSNRRERDIRELFNRLNQLEKTVSRIEGQNR